MDYEKKYKEALERARQFSEKPYLEDSKGIVDYIFPELKESEDERIRKELICYFEKYPSIVIGPFNTKECIAWLEKQPTPQVRTGLEWVNTIDDACDKRYSEEYAHGEYCHEQSFKWGFQEGVDWFEKQGEQKPYGQREECLDCQMNYAGECKGSCVMKRDEQKPADKVESKFHEGDWITDGNITIQIEAIKNNCYLYCGDCILYSTKTADKVYHIWTIEDAKPGDVLAFDDDTIVIFKDLYNATTFHSYCHIEDSEFDISKDEMPDWWEGEGFYPATKEQRDLLFQKMKEAGYEWDAEKKELKKIEQKSADKVEPRFKVGDWITNGIDVYKIKNIDLNEFNYIFENGISDISLVDNICHLWTIQDAKDGDVLVDEDDRPFIFKGFLYSHNPQFPVTFIKWSYWSFRY